MPVIMVMNSVVKLLLFRTHQVCRRMEMSEMPLFDLKKL